MEYKNYFSMFVALYEQVYSDIVYMMKRKGVSRLELKNDEDYGYDRITIVNEYYGNSEDKEVAVVELIGDDIYFENENEHSYEVNRVVTGQNIVDLYDIVYRALYENN